MKNFQYLLISSILITYSPVIYSYYHAGSGWHPKAGTDYFQLLCLTAHANNFSDNTYIHFIPDATAGFDSQYDAYKLLGGYPEVPQIYTTAYGIQLSINTLPSVESNPVIPVGLYVGLSGNYTISAYGMNTFSPEVPIWLYDNVTHSCINLREDSLYAFSYTAGSNEMRFQLFFDESMHILPSNKPLETVFYSDGKIHIRFTGVFSKGEVEIFDITGKIIGEKIIYNAYPIEINVPQGLSVYIVRLTTNNGYTTRTLLSGY
ncbi:MAG: T9SS type A sorting domain-containing protein [Lentimicrobiaceae bacterium]|nr:T9SS type A sorting domain-containing protein [Lentimicrobiaceae bacterium]